MDYYDSWVICYKKSYISNIDPRALMGDNLEQITLNN